jgi:HAMP domain-containing protein
MSTTTERTRKRLFFKIYSESEASHILPGSTRADEILDSLRHDEVRKIYLICPNHSIAMPYHNLFRRLGAALVVRELIIDKLEKQHVYTVKSVIDDVNAAIKKGQSCEIIFFNSSIAGVVLACFHANAFKSVSHSMDHVRRIAPKTVLSGSDIAFINYFTDIIARVPREPEEEYAGRVERPVFEEGPGPAVQQAPARSEAAPLPGVTAPAPGAATGIAPAAEKKLEAAQPRAMTMPESLLLRFRISTKLIALVGLLVAFSLSLMIVVGTLSYKRDSEAKQNTSNSATAQMVGDRLEDELVAALEKARVAAEMYSSGGSSEKLANKAGELLFRDRSNFIFMGIAVRDREDLEFKKTFYNRAYINDRQILQKDIREIHAKNAPSFLDSFRNKVIVRNISPDMGMPVMSISFPYVTRGDGVESIIVCYVPVDRFITAFGAAGGARTFMVSDQGDCVVHGERNRVLSRINMTDVPIVQKMLASTQDRGGMRYRDRDGKYYLGSYRKLDMFGLGVVVTTGEDSVFRELYAIQRRNFAILGIALVVALLCSFMFSRTISVPIDSLKQLTETLPAGGLELTAPGGGDEVYFLTNSFREVYNSYLDARKALEERGPAAAAFAEPQPEAPVEPLPAGDTAHHKMSQQFLAEGLQIQVTYAGPDVTMSWIGRGSLANPGELLNPYLEGVINSLRGRVLTSDFSTLQTMNAALVQSIIRFAEILDENRIQTVFLYNKSLEWQDAAFEALGAFIQGMPTISLDGRQIEKNVFIMQ